MNHKSTSESPRNAILADHADDVLILSKSGQTFA